MDIFFQDPSEIPLPPEEVRIRELKATPWADGKRVQIYLEVDPFQKRPNAEVIIRNARGEQVATASLIESMFRKMEFNMHLRGTNLEGEYIVHASLYYSEPVPEPKEGEEVPVRLPESKIIDQMETSFHIPAS